MSDRVKALLEFIHLNYHDLDKDYMKELHVRILDFSKKICFCRSDRHLC